MGVKITVVGSLNMDMVVNAAYFPKPGETILGKSFTTAAGGKGANQAVAAARMGASVVMIGKVGVDAFGEQLRENLSRNGVGVDDVLMDEGAPTGVALIVVDESGQNSIVVVPGANAKLTPMDVERAGEQIRTADVLLLQLETPLETVMRAAEIAHGAGVPVVLNPAPARDLPQELLAMVDVLTPNETETGALTGLPVGGEAERFQAADVLHALGVETVILTLGESGALLSAEGVRKLVPAFRVRPVDTTAAGDAFMGGFGVAMAEGKSLEEAVRWGNAAGALATTKLGAQPSLPMREDALRLLEEQKSSGEDK